MSIAKVIHVVAKSDKSFDDAVKQGLATAVKTVRGIHGIKVTDWTATVQNDKIVDYKVTMDIAFQLEGS